MAGIQKHPIGSLPPSALAGISLRAFARAWLGDLSQTLLRFLWQITGVTTLLPLIAFSLYLFNSIDMQVAFGMLLGAPIAASLAMFLALWLRASLPAAPAPSKRAGAPG